MSSDWEVYSTETPILSYGYRSDDGHIWEIRLDRSQVNEDDPGAGTPAIVIGPSGEKATFWAAYNEGEIDGRPLPIGVLMWLEDRADAVNDFLYPRKKEEPEEVIDKYVCPECGKRALYLMKYRVTAYAPVVGFDIEGDPVAEDWDWDEDTETMVGYACVNGHRVPGVSTGEEMIRWIEENSNA